MTRFGRSGWHLALAGVLFALAASATSFAEVAFTDNALTVLSGANLSSRSASLADIDGDGDLDLLIVGGTTANPATNSPKLYRNDLVAGNPATLSYTDVTSTMLPSTGLGPSWSSAWGDYNGDGKIDLYIGESNNDGADLESGDLLRNNGAAGFSNESENTGLNDFGFAQNVAWADINNDHRLDLLIGMEGEAAHPEEKHQIYLQDASAHFAAVPSSVGFQQNLGTKGYGMAIGDTDGDGDLDVYISTCRGDNNVRKNFYRNNLKENGSLTFTDLADTNGTQNMKNAYDAEFMDLNNDGKLDLFVAGADGQKTHIYRNTGNNQFVDQALTLASDGFGDLNGAKLIDYDNDGDLDLYFHDNVDGGSTKFARKLYRNDTPLGTSNWAFTDVTQLVGIHVAGAEGGYDGVWGDIDQDGDQDLIDTNTVAFPERVFISNASTNSNHWFYAKLVGPSWNTTGIGSTLYATMSDGSLAGVTLRREANTNAGTFNQSDVPVHFGLGSSTTISDLKIVWPDGFVQHLTGVAANQYLTIHELAGDYNGNGVVDAGDYQIWRDTLGSTTDLRANGDILGASAAVIDLADFLIWKANFGLSVFTGLTAGSGGVAQGVPEPASLWLLAIGGTIAALVRVRRRTR